MITKEKIKKQAPKFYASNLCGEDVKQWYLLFHRIFKESLLIKFKAK